MVCRLVLLLYLSLYALNVSAQTDTVRAYTKENPLVYEDTWNLWPYSFLNDKGEPDGFNIDLLKTMMGELNIPYVIKLKPRQEVFQDLKSGQCDLTLGMTTESYNGGRFGHNLIILFTQSAVTPKNKSVMIKTFRDLGKNGQKVIVSDSSLCHQLMVDYGWKNNAIVSSDISEAIQQVSAKKEGQIVWNTLSLKWLINHYHLDNLTLTHVNMPHGECKYMSNDQHLLNLIDKAYSTLNASDRLTPLEAKWFYPERENTEGPAGKWYLTGLIFILLAIVILYTIRKLRQNQRITEAQNKLSHRLAEITEGNKVRIWTYNVKRGEFTLHDGSGRKTYTLTTNDFAKRYSKDDFAQLKAALDRLISQQKDTKGQEEKEEILELKAKDVEYGDGKLHDFVIMLSVLSRDNNGKPQVIIGTKKDVTKERHLKQMNSERSLRYWSIFYNDEAGILMFDKDGYIQNANPRACELFLFDIDKSVKEHVHINQFFHTEFTSLRDTDGFRSRQTVGKNNIEYQMKTVYNDEEELLNIFVFCL